MLVKLREDWLKGAQVEVAGLVFVAGRPCFEVDPQSDGYPVLGQLLRNDVRVPVLLFMEAFWALRADQPLPLPWDWLELIECFATHLPNEMPEGFAAEPLDEGDALRGEGFEYCVKVTLNQELWEELSGEYDPALGLAELMEMLGFQGVLLPPNCPL
jgi:hypothetical protein